MMKRPSTKKVGFVGGGCRRISLRSLLLLLCACISLGDAQFMLALVIVLNTIPGSSINNTEKDKQHGQERQAEIY